MSFVYEDGHGNAVDGVGRHVLDMDVDDDNYPLDPVTDYDAYTAGKPLERPKNEGKVFKLMPQNEVKQMKRVPYKQHSDNDKEKLFFLVYEKRMTTGKAADQLQIPRRTAYNWVKND